MKAYHSLFKKLQPTDLLLTSNHLLIGFLQHAYADYQQLMNTKVWRTPQLLTFNTWMRLLWEELLLKQKVRLRLLTSQQEQILWQITIKQYHPQLLDISSLASVAQQAWQLQTIWQLPNVLAYSVANEAFPRWITHYLALQTQYEVIDQVNAINTLIQLIRKKSLTLPTRIFLLGWKETTPQCKTFFNALEHAGCPLQIFNPIVHPKECSRMSFSTPLAELQTMTRWALHRWHKQKKRSLCFVPQLHSKQIQVIEQFKQISANLFKERVFTLLNEKKLSELPLFQSLLTLLKLKPQNSFQLTSCFILSPHITGAESERSQRAYLEAKLRIHLENVMHLEQVLLHCESLCPQLHQQIKQLLACFLQRDRLAYCSEWSVYFAKKLKRCGWPGECLNIETHALIEQWHEVLSEFSSLDDFLGKIDEESAIHYLNRLLTSSPIKTRLDYDIPIHILDFNFACGLSAEGCWFSGLDDRTWPAALPMNPLLSYSVQRAQGLPHACNHTRYQHAEKLTQQFLQSAQTIHFSYVTEVNEQRRQISRLLVNIPEQPAEHLALPPYLSSVNTIWQARQWESFYDDTAPPIHLKEIIHGGSQLLKSQAACPFQAFARFRLNANFSVSPQIELPAYERGSLLHNVIELFWNQLEHQQHLLSLNDDDLHKKIECAIKKSLEKFKHKWPHRFTDSFINLEQKRLLHYIKKLIEWDKNRAPFQQVLHEDKQTIHLNDLILQLRLDRCDYLQDGSVLVTDYKTGLPAKINWFEQRLDEPQLPLYCLAQPAASGMAMIHLRSNEFKVQGLIKNKQGQVECIKTKKNIQPEQSWETLRDFWKMALTQLAQQFQSGDAKVDPKKSNTCQTCQLQLMCRINSKEIGFK